MDSENYFSSKMIKMSESELKTYFNNNSDYQEEAVLAALCELEKRGFGNPEILSLKAKLEAREIKNPIQTQNTNSKNIELYSFIFIMLFGVLFSVFASSILIGLNLIQLKNKAKSRSVILSGLAYSLLQVYLMGALKIASPIISVLTSLLGVYMLYQYFIKPELNTDTTYQTKSSWQPLLIGFLISLPVAYFVMKSMAATI
ncbi:MAG: hypothetical protein L3J45_02255 [Flavobacteriaceae bacterium]|nr:hypothetical protein [Flavobacteriaceae bacterium]